MSLLDKEFNFILEVIALVGVVPIVIVKMTKLCGVSLRNVLPYGCRFSIRGFIVSGLKDLYSGTHQGSIIGEFRLILEVQALVIVVRRFLGPFSFVIFAAARPILVRVIVILRTILFRVR